MDTRFGRQPATTLTRWAPCSSPTSGRTVRSRRWMRTSSGRHGADRTSIWRRTPGLSRIARGPSSRMGRSIERSLTSSARGVSSILRTAGAGSARRFRPDRGTCSRAARGSSGIPVSPLDQQRRRRGGSDGRCPGPSADPPVLAHADRPRRTDRAGPGTRRDRDRRDRADQRSPRRPRDHRRGVRGRPGRSSRAVRPVAGGACEQPELRPDALAAGA